MKQFFPNSSHFCGRLSFGPHRLWKRSGLKQCRQLKAEYQSHVQHLAQMMTASLTNKRQEGFTFIELVVVVVIIGILSYAAYVNFSGSHQNVQVQTAARRLVSDVRYAQELAMTTGNETRVYIDVNANRYYLQWATGAYIQKPVGGGDFIVEFGTGDFPDVTITSTQFTNGRLDYLSTGAPRNFGSTFTGTKVLAVLNSSTSVIITANTGRVSVN